MGCKNSKSNQTVDSKPFTHSSNNNARPPPNSSLPQTKKWNPGDAYRGESLVTTDYEHPMTGSANQAAATAGYQPPARLEDAVGGGGSNSMSSHRRESTGLPPPRSRISTMPTPAATNTNPVVAVYKPPPKPKTSVVPGGGGGAGYVPPAPYYKTAPLPITEERGGDDDDDDADEEDDDGYNVSSERPGIPSTQSFMTTGTFNTVGTTGTYRPNRTRDPKLSIRPDLEQSVRTIELQFEDVYELGEQLGYGAFAVVHEAFHKKSKYLYAVKNIDRAKMQWGDRDALEDEIGNLRELREAPHIVQLFEVYEVKDNCLLVMEYLQGGELFDRIIEKKQYTEKEARDAIGCVLTGLQYMHSQRITHRDLKPENLLLVSQNSDTDLKLADFGFAKKLMKPNECRTLCGTPGYLAPEILERWPSYDVKCDTWSVGVILFLLIGGYLPFDDDDENEVFEKTRNGNFKFYRQQFGAVSPQVKDLITRLLTVNVAGRLSASQALEHEWMQTVDNELAERVLTKNLSMMSTTREKEKEKTVKQAAAQKVKAGVQAVIAMNRLKDLEDDFDHYLSKKDRTESIVSVFTTTRPQGAIIADDESLSGQPFSNFYTRGRMLGEGAFSSVWEVTHKATQKVYAAKDIAITKLDPGAQLALQDEIMALKLLRNGPHIIRLYDVFEEPGHTHLILEKMAGGELLQRIVEKEVYTEREARQVCRVMFEAIDYCHNKQIAHRDLKPENLLLVEEGNDTTVKIADFGFAKRVTGKKQLTTLCGTPEYVAPEVLNMKNPGYDTRCDMWSIGVIIFVLLGGYMPFEGELAELAPLILSCDYTFHEEYWSEISQDAQDLIRSLLVVNPDDRPTAIEAMKSKWMTIDGELLARKDLSIAQTQIKQSFHVDILRGAVKAVIASNKLTSLQDSFKSNIPIIDEEKDMLPKAESVDEIPVEESASSGKTFSELYNFGEQLGSGHFSEVHESTHKQSGKVYAVKRVARKGLHEGDAVALQDEINSLRAVQGCPYIIGFRDVFEEPDYSYMILEIFRGGDLIQRIIEKSNYTEWEAREVCKSLLLGVQHMHNKGIANRNLKPDNLYLMSKESDTDVKICDFGFAKKVLYPNSLRTQCGTEGYVAPEILAHHPRYDTKCDMWSLGVIIYILLGGYRPFRGTGQTLMRQIRYGEFEFHDKYWSHVSNSAKDLIRSLLTVNPDSRADADQALNSDWIKSADEDLASQSLDSNLQEFKKEFSGRAKLRGIVLGVIAAQKLQSLGGKPF